jgi:hypothetical protein
LFSNEIDFHIYSFSSFSLTFELLQKEKRKREQMPTGIDQLLIELAISGKVPTRKRVRTVLKTKNDKRIETARFALYKAYRSTSHDQNGRGENELVLDTDDGIIEITDSLDALDPLWRHGLYIVHRDQLLDPIGWIKEPVINVSSMSCIKNLFKADLIACISQPPTFLSLRHLPRRQYSTYTFEKVIGYVRLLIQLENAFIYMTV